jgi:hypothetical protein
MENGDATQPQELSREEENTLKSLNERKEQGPLEGADLEEYDRLTAKYARFEEEGIRRLREARTPSEEHQQRQQEGGGGTMHHILHGTQFWGSLLATAVPGYVGRQLGFTNEGDWLHWNWITDKLILGALPVKSQVGASGDHLTKMAKQLEEYHQSVGMVVSCVQPQEFEGYGVTALEFVKHKDWTDVLHVTEFIMVPMQDFGADISFEMLLDTTERMYRMMYEQNQCVYVHCKAGKGRSWVMTMCYLMSQEGMTYEAAEALVKSRRHQVSPSASQVAKVKEFYDTVARQRRALCMLRRESSMAPMPAEEFELLRERIKVLPHAQRKVLLQELSCLDFDFCDEF